MDMWHNNHFINVIIFVSFFWKLFSQGTKKAHDPLKFAIPTGRYRV